ncbi:MAG: protein translocase subunit SecD [Candidatus Taylorbacteria bacterium]|nr:protein translocase subunit SecD [Candidatus Taylorbacteria bacterium]
MRTRILAVMLLLLGVLIGYFTYASQIPGSKWGSFPFKLGLDLNGGTHLVYKADVTAIPRADVGTSMESLRDVIEKRVNLFGVGEPIVQIESAGVLGSAEASQKLIVELPGVTDISEAVKSIGQTPLLEFRILKTADLDAIATASTTVAEKEKMFAAALGGAVLTGGDLKRATLEFDQNTRQPVVSLQLNDRGKDAFAKVTKENVGNILGIFLDGKQLQLPTIRQPILDGRAQISGGFTLDEAKVLVRNLNYGALPVPIELISTQTVGASLGQDALWGGIRAGLAAFIIIGIFLIVWYRLPGVIAVVALAIYTIITLALFKLIPVTLTAAGIAGFILSIGMAVDANILIFERMKEELLSGKSMSDSMHEGFARAWLSIRDSNLSSIITGVILYYFGNSSVIKGFALVFVLGVLISMFSAITASRLFLYAIAPKGNGKVARFFFSNGFHFNRSHN